MNLLLVQNSRFSSRPWRQILDELPFDLTECTGFDECRGLISRTSEKPSLVLIVLAEITNEVVRDVDALQFSAGPDCRILALTDCDSVDARTRLREIVKVLPLQGLTALSLTTEIQHTGQPCEPGERWNEPGHRSTGPSGATVHEGSKKEATQPDDPGSIRVLYVEDAPDNQRLLSLLLKKVGASVTLAENGKIGLQEALKARTDGMKYDVILMDMQMPVMDGYEATRQLRAADYDGPIIALTAHAMTGDREKCIEAGCDEYATKPINRSQLMELIRRFAGADCT